MPVAQGVVAGVDKDVWTSYWREVMALRPGQVRDAILDFFDRRKSAAPATIAEIRAHAERILGNVPPSSVRSHLQLSKDFERVGRGAYIRKR